MSSRIAHFLAAAVPFSTEAVCSSFSIGSEGAAAAAAAPCDSAFTAISMPGFSGHDFIRSVRQLPDVAARRTPAIALTAFNEPEQRRLALAAGFQTFMVKPFDPHALVQEIQHLASS